MQSPNIVLAGHVCIDHNTTENATYTNWGSSVLYMAQYLEDTYSVIPAIFSSYGPDILPYLPSVDLIPSQPNQPQTLVYENDTRHQPRIWKAHNIEFGTSPDITPEVIKILREADIVIVATLLPNYTPAYISELLSHTRQECLTILCPQGFLRHVQPDGLVVPRTFAEAEQIVPLFDLVIYSEEDHPQALELAQAWCQLPGAAGQIIVTQGEKGATIVHKNGMRPVPTAPLRPEEILDSVGCGDVFDAAVAYHYHQTADLTQAVAAANRAAGQKLRAVAPARRS